MIDEHEKTGYFDLPDEPLYDDSFYGDDELDEDVNAFDDYSLQQETLSSSSSQPSRTLDERVIRQLEFAFDNLPPSEVHAMFSRIWQAESDNSFVARTKVIELTKQAEELESYVLDNPSNYPIEYLGDNIRVVRSQIRSICNSPEFQDFCRGSKSPGLDFKWPWQM
jgi:hypothetical protein